MKRILCLWTLSILFCAQAPAEHCSLYRADGTGDVMVAVSCSRITTIGTQRGQAAS